jgi:hypothetical protein
MALFARQVAVVVLVVGGLLLAGGVAGADTGTLVAVGPSPVAVGLAGVGLLGFGVGLVLMFRRRQLCRDAARAVR